MSFFPFFSFLAGSACTAEQFLVSYDDATEVCLDEVAVGVFFIPSTINIRWQDSSHTSIITADKTQIIN